MKILMITTNDPAGMGINFTNAINKYTEHHCRLVTTEQRYGIDFGKDLHVPDLDEDQLDELRDVLTKADIFHFHMIADENMNVGPLLVKDFIRGKRIIHHHHGHPEFRINPKKFHEKYKKLKRKAIVSTPDLLHLLPDSTWQPNLVPINDPLYLPAEKQQENDAIIIGQSPTRRELKNCAELEWAIAEARKELPRPIIHRSFERLQHKKCLAEKRKCDIIFDHMQGYFGVSSLESLSQGKPVIAGLDEWNISHIKNFVNSDKIPWDIVENIYKLKSIIIKYTKNHLTIKSKGNESRKFMVRSWNETNVINVLENAYNII